MMDGFGYIKELLLQNHNFHMYETYEKLKANNINVYAVKSDAFHIAKKDVRKAQKAGESKATRLVPFLRAIVEGKMKYQQYRFIHQKGKK